MPISELPIPRTNRLLVPREDRSWLLSPAPAAATQLVLSNSEALSSSDIQINGCSLACLRQRTRVAVAAASDQYLSELGIANSRAANVEAKKWVVGGHQPTLFHPGVWAKNFALARLADCTGAVGLNLIVDNDTLGSTSVRVPAGTTADPQTTDVPFDAPQLKQPWENVRVLDQELFRRFPDRIQETMQGWGVEPLVRSYWPRVWKLYQSTGKLVDAFSGARRLQEADWGVRNQELPLSRLCRLPPFLCFLCHILTHLERFQSVYNQSVREYRLANRIHSTSHPVPELVRLGDWLEAPFWIWKQGDFRRSRLFARKRGSLVELSLDGTEVLIELSLESDCHSQAAIDRLQELQEQGVCIRTRALTTTLFSRVCLADIFVHGIGGAKYDEITDQLIARFFGLPVPGYWVVTGTLHLPLGRLPVTADDLARAKHHLRDLTWNPAQALADHSNPGVQALLQEFNTALENPTSTSISSRDRHRELSQIKQQLVPWAKELESDARSEIERITRQLAANRVLQNRDFSSLLYPAEMLRGFLQQAGQ